MTVSSTARPTVRVRRLVSKHVPDELLLACAGPPERKVSLHQPIQNTWAGILSLSSGGYTPIAPSTSAFSSSS